MAVSQQQIANKLKLSIATVSRSLKNDLSISARTRALVMETASQLGYEALPMRPKRMSAGKSKNTQLSFGVVIQTDADNSTALASDVLLSGYLSGLSEAAYRSNVSLIMHYVPLEHREQAADPELLPFALRNRQVSGLVLINWFSENTVKALLDNFPCVALAYQYDLPCLDIVRCNEYKCFKTLTEQHFVRGHRQIGFMGDVCDRTGAEAWRRNRYHGYAEALLCRNEFPESRNIFNAVGRVIPDDMYLCLKKRIKEGLSALVCDSDDTAYEVINRLENDGIRVPEEVSISGYDNITAPSEAVRLQTAYPNARIMGMAAYAALCERLKTPGLTSRQILIDGNIMDGQSVRSR